MFSPTVPGKGRKKVNVQELLNLLENPLVIRRLREILGEDSPRPQATMEFRASSAGASHFSEEEQQLKRKIDRLSKALEESREKILRLQEENDTLRGQLEQANHSIQEFLQNSF